MTTQHIVCPGTAGNYISTESSNVADADTAHLVQSAGKWQSMTLSSDLTPLFGATAARRTAVTTANTPHSSGMSTGLSGIAIGASTLYAVSVGAGYEATVSGDDYEIRVDLLQYDAGGGSLGSTIISDYASYAADALHVLTGTFTSHASAAFVSFIVYYRSETAGAGRTIGDYYYLDALCIREGSDTTFVPSLGIVGDLDLRAKVALDDWTPASASYILTNLSGFTGYQLYVNTSGELISRYGDGSSTRSEGTTALGFTDASAHVVTVEWDESAGTLEWFADGASIGTDSYSAGAGDPSDQPLQVGNGVDGDVYYVEIRDGIDGPIVARMDAVDAAGVS